MYLLEANVHYKTNIFRCYFSPPEVDKVNVRSYVKEETYPSSHDGDDGIREREREGCGDVCFIST